MTDSINKNIIHDLFHLINGHSVLFAYDEKAKMPEIVQCLISSFLDMNDISISTITFTEKTKWSCDNFKCNQCMYCMLYSKYGKFTKFSAGLTSTDMTSLLLDIESKIDQKQLIFLEDLGFIRWIKNKTAFLHFLDLLFSIMKDAKGTMICTIALNTFEIDIQKLLFSVFNTIFYVTEDSIQLGLKKSVNDIQYAFENGRLILKPAVSTDLRKVKEIFSLSPEEEKELDKIVHKHLEEYKK
ncbi:MAG: hypothetical protein H5T43_07680 [Methanomethylovorans sp.]|nr:hypothetical protein [Methanomethylovorans sp.]